MTRYLSNQALNKRLLTELNGKCNLIAKKSQGTKIKFFEVRGPKVDFSFFLIHFSLLLYEFLISLFSLSIAGDSSDSVQIDGINNFEPPSSALRWPSHSLLIDPSRVFIFIFYLQLCCGGLCLSLCSCGGLEYFPTQVINQGVGVLDLRVRFFEFLFGYDLGVLAFSMFILLGLAKLKMVQ